jgi:hypothetical protein
MTDARCPQCGQRMLTRVGMQLSPRQADIFDLITNSGDRGLEQEVLADVLSPGKPRYGAMRLVAVHVNNINPILEETNFAVRKHGGKFGRYRLAKVRSPC